MNLPLIFQKAVNTASDIFDSVKVEVSHATWIRQNEYGDQVYGRRVNGVWLYGDHNAPNIAYTRRCVVELDHKIRQVSPGRSVMTFAHIIFIEPFDVVDALGSERQEPIDTRDVIILPGGQTGPIVDIKGVVDPTYGLPFLGEVWLGAREGIAF